MSNVIDLLHSTVGLLFILLAARVFTESLNVSDNNLARIRGLSLATAIFMWAVLLLGGCCYVFYYAPSRMVIMKGPWPAAHRFFMETKEHVVFVILLLATFLPILASNDIVRNRSARALMLWVSGLMVGLGASVEVAGNIIVMGAKVALMAH